MRRKRILSILTAVAMMIGVTACGASDSGKTNSNAVYPGTKDADMVTLNIVSEPMDLNPVRIGDAISLGILSHCMSGFTRLDEKDNAVADLAESWDINDDNTVYTMHLKKDAKWSNGDPVTVNDFYFSWVKQMTPSTGSLYASYLYLNIKNGEAFYNDEIDVSKLGLTVVDDYTLKIEWSHPITEANALFYLSQPFYLPLNQTQYEKIGDEQYAKEADKMVTNGAYQITEWVHDDHITMEKSKDYYDADKVNVPKMKLAMIGDSNTSLNAFTAGELDMSNLYSEQIGQVKEKNKDIVYSYVDGGTWYINFNNQYENLSNVNLRKALTHSIDVQSLLDNVINDGSIIADGLVPNVIAGVDGKSYSEARGSLFAYDKEAGAEYLDKALKELGKTKEDLKLVFWCSDSTYSQNQGAYLQQQWKETLGLDVELKTMPANSLQEAQYSGEFSFTVDGWGPTENDAITFLENFQTGGLNNTEQYSNSEYDRLIQEAIQESDAAKRQELLIQAEETLIEDMAVGPMYYTCTTYAVSEKLEGLVRTPFQPFNLRYAKIVTE